MEIVNVAVNVVKDRFNILQQTARGKVQAYLRKENNCCYEVLKYALMLMEGSMTVDKIFLADLVVAVTRIWEAFSTRPDGNMRSENILPT